MTFLSRALLVCFSLLLTFGAIASETDSESIHLDTPPDINNWGFDVGFGSQPYMERVPKVGLISPHLFGGSHGSNWRASFDFSVKTLQAFDSYSIADLALSLESNTRVYKDLVYSFVKFGVGTMIFEDEIFDGNVMTLPVSLGFQLITTNTKKGVLSYFVEYRFIALSDYKIEKSLPSQSNVGIEKDALFSGTTSLGVRYIF